jgi:hypothetical protein
MVQVMAQYGVPQEQIRAALVTAGFEPMGETKFAELYREELDAGKAIGDSKLLETAFKVAVEGKNVAMLCFLLKTRLGMRETNRVEMTSPDGSMSPNIVRLDKFTPEQIAALKGEYEAQQEENS